MSYTGVSVGSSATLIVPSNAYRLNLILRNNSSTVCYIGQDSNVTTATGMQINQNDALNDDGSGRRGYLGEIWGITATGSADIRYWERVVQ